MQGRQELLVLLLQRRPLSQQGLHDASPLAARGGDCTVLKGSLEGATSMADLEWQLRSVGSAP
ncbi:hypothetical protein E2C01_010536 [Portunus trituberculatus]|uniref:Uncharacterized protein n=1 Tax=Portunus trituberculatus TaxID=210409 RepID=A0A5B7D8Y6_PORTR|nr:hypothetical protein [Portunus trituberculatus]